MSDDATVRAAAERAARVLAGDYGFKAPPNATGSYFSLAESAYLRGHADARAPLLALLRGIRHDLSLRSEPWPLAITQRIDEALAARGGEGGDDRG